MQAVTGTCTTSSTTSVNEARWVLDVCFEVAQSREEILRRSGLYGEKVGTSKDADRQAQLLALVGREA